MMIERVESRVRNDQFQRTKNHDRGRPTYVFCLWYLLKCVFFLSPLPWPTKLKVAILKAFGAKVGKGVYIKPRVNIHYPWKVTIGDYSWIGEEVLLVNFEPIRIGANCCISQRATICAGNHDFRDPAMSYKNAPIEINSGAWIGCMAFISPGITVGVDAVVSAFSMVCSDVLPASVVRGNPAQKVADRYRKTKDT